MTLQEAWEKRKPMWAEGSKLIEEGNKLWKEIASMPATGALRASVWHSLSEMSKEAAEKVFHGYALRCEADGIWNDSLTEIVGAKAKVVWTYDATKQAYSCTLEHGEVFEP